MKTGRIDSINFEARSKTIRYADDIARKVNKCFPRVSSTLVFDMPHADKFKRLALKLTDDVDNMRHEKWDSFYDAETPWEKIKSFIKPIKKHKVGNCSESAQLSAIVAKACGIKNCYIVGLETSFGDNLDHAVLFVEDEKPYIIDSWLGFADYVPNAIIKLKSEFSHHFDDSTMNHKWVFTMNQSALDKFLNKDLSKKQIRRIRKAIPEIRNNIYEKH